MEHLRAREFEPTTEPEDRRSETRVTADRNVAANSLVGVMIFALITCLIVANVMFRFSDLGLAVEQSNLFAGP